MSHYPPIQIVNENDEPIGGASMQEAYMQGLRHRVVHIFIEDSKKNILLQKRSASVATNPSRWDISVGGHVDEGEDYLTAAQRELQEELGLKNRELTLLGGYYKELSIGTSQLKRFVKVFRLIIPHETPITFPPEEISEVKWMSLTQTSQLIAEHPEQVADGLVECMQEYY